MRAVWKTVDRDGRLVILLYDTWHLHVLDPETGHPELAGYENCAKDTVENPNLVVQSSRSPTSDIYIKLGAVPAHPNLYLRVPVDFADNEYGRVLTVMLTRSSQLFQGTTGLGGIKYGRLK